jgi:hypothetical protein
VKGNSCTIHDAKAELNRRSQVCPAGCLAALRMVAHDDPPGPTIRLRVSKCPMKNRTVLDFAVKLRTCQEWNRLWIVIIREAAPPMRVKEPSNWQKRSRKRLSPFTI